MIETLITIILVELIIVLGMYIVTWIANLLFWEEPEPAVVYSGELSKEDAEVIKKIFEERKDD
jgi:hypothetical protein